MLIGIDGNEANIQNRVGVGQFAFNILHQLHQLDTQNKYLIYLKSQPLSDLPAANQNWQYQVFGPQKLWTRFALPIKLYTQRPKLSFFYSPSHYSPPFSPFPTIPTIHDLGYLQYKDQFTPKDFFQLKNWTKESIDRSSHLVTVSQFSKDEIIKIYSVDPQKITVVPNGVGDIPQISAAAQNQTLLKFNIKKPYFLYLGTLKPNKNIPLLIKAFQQFLDSSGKDFQLVIAGKKGWLYQQIFSTVSDLNLTQKIIFTDFINETEKWSLYKNSYTFIIPSLYEGFGIPALEAMKSGTPVIASNIPPLSEVVSQNGYLFDPTSQNQLTKAMLAVTKPGVRLKLQKLGKAQSSLYTWEKSAKKLISLFSTL